MYDPMAQGDVNSVFQSANNDGLASGSPDFASRVTDFFKYGIVDSMTSGAVGLYNSVKAVGNAFGAELPMTNINDVVASIGGTDSLDYYKEHKVGMDAIGFAATAVATGVGAISGLRALQAGGAVNLGFRAATGFTGTDIILGSAEAQAYRAAVVANPTTYSWVNPKFVAAVGWAARQNVQEALVGEAVFMLTHNQSPLLNPEGLSAWESSKEIFVSGLPLTGAFTALGTGLDAFRIVGSAKRAFKATEAGALGKMQTIGSELTVARGATPGDQLVSTQEAARKLASPEYDVGAMEDLRIQFGPEATDAAILNAVQVRRSKAEAQLKAHEEKQIIELNGAGQAGLDAMRQVLDTAQPDTQRNLLSNLRNIGYLTAEHTASLGNFIHRMPQVVGTTRSPLPSGLDDFQQLAELTKRRMITSSRAQQVLAGKLISDRGGRKLLNEILAYGSEHEPELESVLQGVQRDVREFYSKLGRNQKLTDIADVLSEASPAHAVSLVEGLARAITRLQVGDNASLLSRKYPAIAAYAKEQSLGIGAGEGRAYYNLRTGKAVTYTLPRAQDTHSIAYTRNGIEAVERTTEGNRLVLPYSSEATSPKHVLEAYKDENRAVSPEFEASAHFAAAAQRPITVADGYVYVPHNDIAMLDRVASATPQELRAVAGIRLTDGANVVHELNKGGLAEYALALKKEYRSMYQAARLNEHNIAVLLHSGLDFARGVSDEDAMIMGKLDPTKPESVIFRYRTYGSRQLDLEARTAVALQQRAMAIQGQRNAAAAQVLGEDYSKLPDESALNFGTLSQTDQKAGLLTQALSEFGSLREKAAYIGSVVHGLIDKARLGIEQSYLPHYKALAVKTAEGLQARAELSLFNNAARTYRYSIMDVNGTVFAVRDDTYMQKFAELEQQLAKVGITGPHAQEQAHSMLTQEDALRAIASSKDGSAYVFSATTGDVIRTHMKHNVRFNANDRALAAAQGRNVTREDHIYYPPPVNLRRTPYHAFVVPTKANAELPSFMIYGASKAELDLKRAHVEQKYGPRYKVVDDRDVARYKQLQGTYEKGDMFDSWEVDGNLQRLGKAGNLEPSLDIDATETLDLMRNWTHRKNERQIKQAVEAKYASTVQTLRMADEAYDASATTALPITREAARTVFSDTLKVMTSSDSATGVAVTGYRRINDWVGENGSRVLDGAVDAITRAAGVVLSPAGKLYSAVRGAPVESFKFDEAALEKLTKDLAESGFVNPYEDLTMAMARSKVISDGRSLMQATRVLNTLVAGTQLRLDWWNSVVQVMSVPILMNGLVREAKVALAGTAEGKKLAELTTVRNPGSGQAEPTAAKLLQRAVKAYWTEDGKAFATELRKRYILGDETRIYLEAQDFSSLNGRHTLRDVQQKIDDFMQVAQKPFMHRFSEDFSRFLVAHAFKEIAELRGLSGEEMYAAIRNGVDRVHGIHRSHMKFQLFNGVLGQSLGLFQTYMWNVAQQMLKHVADGRTRELAAASFMQSTLFGVRSLPAFHSLNQLVADTNDGKLDLYSLSGTDDDPRSLASYVMYGAMSNILPADLFSRGEFTVRYNTVVPLNPADWPAVSVVSKAVGNMARTIGMLPEAVQGGATLDEKVGNVANVLSYGLAHNALNRPLAGWGQLWAGKVTTNSGTPLFQNINYTNYDPTEEVNWSAVAARALGGKPTAEAIMLDSYYRRVAYQTEQHSQLNKLGERIRTTLGSDGQLTDEMLESFTSEYEAAGGTLENFHAYLGRQLGAAKQSSVDLFRQKLQTNSAFSRAYGRLAADRATTPMWQQDQQLLSYEDVQAAQE